MKELIIRTDRNGVTEVEVQGVKGPACTKILEALSLQKKDVKNTSEYNEPEIQYIVSGS